MKGKEKGATTLSPRKSLQLEGERPCSSGGCAPQVATAPCLPFVIRTGTPGVWKDRLLTAHPGSYKLCKLFTAACHRVWGMVRCCCAERLKVTEIKHSLPSGPSPGS